MDERDDIRTIPDLLRIPAQRNPHSPALEFGSRLYTYRQLEDRTDRLAAALRGLGVVRGDRVGYLAKNSDRFFELMFAAGKLGAAVTPFNWRLTATEIGYILQDCRPGVVWVGGEFHGLLDEALGASGAATHTLVCDEEEPPGLDAEHTGDVAAVPLDPEETAILLYTSGTTGKPKGVMLSHRALIELRAREARGPDWLRWDPSEICLVSMPLFHISGIRLALAAMYNGCHVLVVPEFNAASMLEIIGSREVSWLLLVPSALQMLARSPEAATTDFSRVRYIYYGGAPITPALLQECTAVFDCDFVQSYGATETAGAAVCLGPEDHRLADPPKIASVGRPILGVEVRLTSPQGDPVPAGQFGEVNIRSPGNMSGYWGNPEATRAVLTDDGWLRTGDGGHIDADGYLFLKDRIKDMIISGGENIYPIEVENALARHPAVAEVAVFGVSSEKWGEEVRAAVVLRPGAHASEQALIGWARQLLASFKTPKRIAFMDALPRNASGKILKRELRLRYAERSAAA